jgi:Tfp pilus assembly protein PilF
MKRQHNMAYVSENINLAYRLDNSPLMASYRAGVYASAGRTAEAKKMLDQINEMTKKRYSCSYEVAVIYVALGQNDRAFEWFDRAREARSDCMPNLRVDPRLDPLRADARFVNLLRSVGFTE